MMPMEARSVAVSTPNTPRHQYSMNTTMPYFTTLESKRHTVSPRVPSTSDSRRSTHCAIVATVIATHAYMMDAVTANTFTPRSQPSPRM